MIQRLPCSWVSMLSFIILIYDQLFLLVKGDSCQNPLQFYNVDTSKCECIKEYYPNELDPNECLACNPKCASCTSRDICVTCKQNLNRNTDTCDCLDHYYDITNQAVCGVCSETCKQCLYQGYYCTECFPGQNREAKNNTCQCIQSYYEPLSPQSNLACLPCASSCLSCVETETKCTSCGPLKELTSGNICLCVQGYYPDDSAQYKCSKCNIKCMTCLTKDECQSCDATQNRESSGNSCVCFNHFFEIPNQAYCASCSNFCKKCEFNMFYCTDCDPDQNRQIKSNSCQCFEQFFEPANPADNQYKCQACATTCANCVDQANKCTECNSQRHLTSQNTCLCKNGSFEDNNLNCQPCSMFCQTCTNDKDHCLSCHYEHYRQLNEQQFQCQCMDGYFEQIDEQSQTALPECTKCDYSCMKCSGAGPQLCTECYPNSHRAQITTNPSSCMCVPGFFEPHLGSWICISCHYSCKTCDTSFSPDTCLSCDDSLHRIPSTTTQYFACECQASFYDDGSHSLCQSCHQSCYECIGAGANNCKSCSLQHEDLHRIATPRFSACPCLAGFYEDLQSGLCISCHASCATCSDAGSDKCLSCDSSDKHRVKQQPQQSIGSCLCDQISGFFEDTSTPAPYLCQPCHYSCATCIDGNQPTDCTSCPSIPELNRIANIISSKGNCPCKPGTNDFGQKQCSYCHFSCQTCSAPGPQFCQDCPPDSNRVFNQIEHTCNCNPVGYFSQGNICQKCSNGCASCQDTSTYCTSCFDQLDDFNRLNEITESHTCPCKPGFYDDQTNKECQPCSRQCSMCSLGASRCTACPQAQSYQRLDFAAIDNTCPCKSGFFDDGHQAECQPCDSSCFQCSGSAQHCTACPSSALSYRLNAASTEGGWACPCQEGFFSIANNQQCQSCSHLCLACDKASERCTKCPDAFQTKRQQSAAVDGQGSFMTCNCQIGFYDDGSSPACKPCHYSCAACKGDSNEFSCTSCPDSSSSHRYFLPGVGETGSCPCNTAAGYTDDGRNNQICQLCHYSCASCSGPGPNNCLSCSGVSQQRNDQTNDQHSCLCLDNYYDDGQTLLCKPCHYSCQTCAGPGEQTCLTCPDSTSNRQLSPDTSPGKCLCQQGYYDDGGKICEQCHYSCDSCSGSGERKCLSCPTPEGTYHRNTVQDGQCLCTIGYNDDGVKACEYCHYSCKTCSAPGKQFCVTCGGAQYNREEVPSNGQCLCLIGTFDDLQQQCQPCFKACASCIQNTNYCLSCKSNVQQYNRIDQSNSASHSCPCLIGYYDTLEPDVIICQKCHFSCSECIDSATKCIKCPQQDLSHRMDRSNIDFTCPCLQSYYDDDITSQVIPDKQICQACHQSCAACSGSQQSCIICPDIQKTFRIDQSVPAPSLSGRCPCQEGYFDAGTTVCQPCATKCKSCVNQADNCLSCPVATFRIMPANGDTPPFACQCLDRYYDKGDAKCARCHYSCARCQSGSDKQNCINPCSVGSNRVFVLHDGQQGLCTCDASNSFYDDGINESCKKCHYSCQTCSDGGPHSCLTCFYSSDQANQLWLGYHRLNSELSDQNKACPCLSGFYDSGEVSCSRCHYSCQSCLGPGMHACTYCAGQDVPASRVEQPTDDGSCPCKPQFYDDGTANCKKCHYSCNLCNGPSPSSCTQCDIDGQTKYNRSSSQNPQLQQCPCNDGYVDVGEVKCVACHYSCHTCIGPGRGNCASCWPSAQFTGYNRVETVIDSQCPCIDKFFDDGSTVTCVACSPACATCEARADYCKQCPSNLQDLNRLDRITFSNSCPCMTGFFDDYQNSGAKCQPCHYSCVACQGGPDRTNCTACPQQDQFKRSDSSLIDRTCPCLPGYFDDGVHQTCSKCDPSCLLCEDDPSHQGKSCTKCPSSGAQTFRIDLATSLHRCPCMPGYYEVSGQQVCAKCNYNCKTCIDLANKCTSCQQGVNRDDDLPKACPCSPGFYDNGADTVCSSCHYSCQTCAGGNTPQNCLTCLDESVTHRKFVVIDAQTQQGTCSCDTVNGYLDNGVTSFCSNCHYSCLTCNGAGPDKCLSCIDSGSSHRSIDLANSRCPCLSQFYDNGQSVCKPCHYSCLYCNGASPTSCTSCPDTQTSHRKQDGLPSCLCSDGFFDNGVQICASCHYSCSTCSGPGEKACLICPGSPSNRVNLRDNTGACPCLPNFSDDGLKQCEYCHYSCDTCSRPGKDGCLSCPGFAYNRVDILAVGNTCPCSNGFYDDVQKLCKSCHVACATCDGPRDTQCLSCKPGASTSLNRAVQSSACPCVDGFWDDGIHDACQPCSNSCRACAGGAGKKQCTSCNQDSNFYRINRALVDGSCPCLSGYYDDGIHSECQICHYSCIECVSGNGPNQCTSCPPLNRIKDSNSVLTEFSCLCLQSFYDVVNQKNCSPCSNRCLECIGQKTKCTKCLPKATSNREDNSYSPVYDCPCTTGFFDDGTSLSCLKCHYSCQACSIGPDASQCSMCPIESNMFRQNNISVQTQQGTCPCQQGYYDIINQQNCAKCHYTCLTCKGGAGFDKCTECPPESQYHRVILDNSKCPCALAFYDIDDGTNNIPDAQRVICQPCHYSCRSCVNSLECLTCPQYDLTFRNDLSKSPGKSCPCSTGYFDENKQICARCHYSCLACQALATDTSCTTCPPNSFRFTLPQQSGNTVQCPCLQHFFDAGQTVCQACHYSCLNCTGQRETDCTTCYSSFSTNRVGSPISLQPSGTQCKCLDGYFDNGALVCEKCHFSCETCLGSGDSNSCITCPNPIKAANRIAVPDQGRCLCQTFYYEVSMPACNRCHRSCQNCFSYDENSCSVCPPTDTHHRTALPDSNHRCLCQQGYYDDGLSAPCMLCHYSCLACKGSNSPSNCTACPNLAFRDDQSQSSGGICPCTHLYYDDLSGRQSCRSCHYSCDACNGPDELSCTKCPQQSQYFRDDLSQTPQHKCPCSVGYYNIDLKMACSSCHYSCLTCVGGNTANKCTTCPPLSTNRQQSLSGLGECLCLLGYTDNGNKACDSCHYSCDTCAFGQSSVCLTCPTSSNRVTEITNSNKCPCIVNYYDAGSKKCQRCLLTCMTCLNGQTCEACYEAEQYRTLQQNQCVCIGGYYEDNQSPTCQKCDYTCLTCFGTRTQCTSCTASNQRTLTNGKCPCNQLFFDNGQSICNSCHITCLECSGSNSETSCTACDDSTNHRIPGGVGGSTCLCKNGYYPIAGQAVCEKCHSFCQLCVGGTQSDCTNCDSDQMHRTPDTSDPKKCVCIQGYYQQDNNPQCQLCHNSCQACSGPSSSECQLCNIDHHRAFQNNQCPCITGYFDVGTAFCSQCVYSCKTCVSSAANCISCDSINNFREYNSLSHTCPCMARYYDNGIDKCASCHYSCATCKNSADPTSCQTCNSTVHKRYLSSLNECLCQDTFYDDHIQSQCQNCHPQCTKCLWGDQNSCISCDYTNQFRKPDGHNHCICREGYFEAGSLICSKCDDLCETCVSTKTYCLSCYEAQQHRTLKTGNVCSCQDYFYDVGQLVCKACHYSCKTCTSQSKFTCLSCPDGPEMHRDLTITAAGTCICKQNYFDNGQQTICQECHQACNGCTGPGTDQCVQCSDLYFLLGNQCVRDCPDGQFEDRQQATCAKCDPRCLTCVNQADVCKVCSDFRDQDTAPLCSCISGYFEGGLQACAACAAKCQSCSDTADSCLTCGTGRENPPACRCKQGYIEDPDTLRCIEFKTKCPRLSTFLHILNSQAISGNSAASSSSTSQAQQPLVTLVLPDSELTVVAATYKFDKPALFLYDQFQGELLNVLLQQINNNGYTQKNIVRLVQCDRETIISIGFNDIKLWFLNKGDDKADFVLIQSTDYTDNTFIANSILCTVSTQTMYPTVDYNSSGQGDTNTFTKQSVFFSKFLHLIFAQKGNPQAINNVDQQQKIVDSIYDIAGQKVNFIKKITLMQSSSYRIAQLTRLNYFLIDSQNQQFYTYEVNGQTVSPKTNFNVDLGKLGLDLNFEPLIDFKVHVNDFSQSFQKLHFLFVTKQRIVVFEVTDQFDDLDTMNSQQQQQLVMLIKIYENFQPNDMANQLQSPIKCIFFRFRKLLNIAWLTTSLDSQLQQMQSVLTIQTIVPSIYTQQQTPDYSSMVFQSTVMQLSLVCDGCNTVDIFANYNSQQIVLLHDLAQCKSLFHTIEWDPRSDTTIQFSVYNHGSRILGQTAKSQIQQLAVGQEEVFFITGFKELKDQPKVVYLQSLSINNKLPRYLLKTECLEGIQQFVYLQSVQQAVFLCLQNQKTFLFNPSAAASGSSTPARLVEPLYVRDYKFIQVLERLLTIAFYSTTEIELISLSFILGQTNGQQTITSSIVILSTSDTSLNDLKKPLKVTSISPYQGNSIIAVISNKLVLFTWDQGTSGTSTSPTVQSFIIRESQQSLTPQQLYDKIIYVEKFDVFVQIYVAVNKLSIIVNDQGSKTHTNQALPMPDDGLISSLQVKSKFGLLTILDQAHRKMYSCQLVRQLSTSAQTVYQCSWLQVIRFDLSYIDEFLLDDITLNYFVRESESFVHSLQYVNPREINQQLLCNHETFVNQLSYRSRSLDQLKLLGQELFPLKDTFMLPLFQQLRQRELQLRVNNPQELIIYLFPNQTFMGSFLTCLGSFPVKYVTVQGITYQYPNSTSQQNDQQTRYQFINPIILIEYSTVIANLAGAILKIYIKNIIIAFSGNSSCFIQFDQTFTTSTQQSNNLLEQAIPRPYTVQLQNIRVKTLLNVTTARLQIIFANINILNISSLTMRYTNFSQLMYPFFVFANVSQAFLRNCNFSYLQMFASESFFIIYQSGLNMSNVNISNVKILELAQQTSTTTNISQPLPFQNREFFTHRHRMLVPQIEDYLNSKNRGKDITLLLIQQNSELSGTGLVFSGIDCVNLCVGAVLNVQKSSAIVSNSLFQNNKALVGGAIVATRSFRLLDLTNTQFISNQGQFLGGAVYIDDLADPVDGKSIISKSSLSNIKFISNNAEQGGGLFINQNSDSHNIIFNFQNLNYIQNTASYGGAYQYVGQDSTVVNLVRSSSVFSQNQALKSGADGYVYPQGLALVQYEVNPVVNQLQPYLCYSKCNVSNIQSGNIYKVTIELQLIGDTGFVIDLDPKENKIYEARLISSATTSVLITGINPVEYNYTSRSFQFKDITFTGIPNSLQSIYVATTAIKVPVNGTFQFTYAFPLDLAFRECIEGEIMVEKRITASQVLQECQTCKSGTYSLMKPLDVNTHCKMCPENSGVTCKGGNIIEVQRGFWRAINATDLFTERCTLNVDVCIGGEGMGDNLCALGYVGPLCESCNIQLNYIKSLFQCLKCPELNGNIILSSGLILGYLTVIMVIAIILTVSVRKKVLIRQIRNFFFFYKSGMEIKISTTAPSERENSDGFRDGVKSINRKESNSYQRQDDATLFNMRLVRQPQLAEIMTPMQQQYLQQQSQRFRHSSQLQLRRMNSQAGLIRSNSNACLPQQQVRYNKKLDSFLTNKDENELSNVIKILINHFQIIIVIKYYDLRLPNIVANLFTIAGDPPESITQSFNCLLYPLSQDFNISPVYLQLGFNIMFYFMSTILIWVIFIRLKSALAQYLIATSIMLNLSLFQPSIFFSCIDLMTCRQIAGQEYVKGDLTLECYSSVYQNGVFFTSCIILLIGFIIPFLIYYKIHKRIIAKKSTNKFNYVISQYSNQFYYWETIKTLLKFVIYAITSIFFDLPINRAILSFSIISLYYIISNKFQPYRQYQTQEMDNESTLVCAISMILAAIMVANQNQTIGNIAFFILIIINIGILSVNLYRAIRNVDILVDLFHQFMEKNLLKYRFIRKFISQKYLFLHYYSILFRQYMRLRLLEQRKIFKNPKKFTNLVRDLGFDQIKDNLEVKIELSIYSDIAKDKLVAMQESVHDQQDYSQASSYETRATPPQKTDIQYYIDLTNRVQDNRDKTLTVFEQQGQAQSINRRSKETQLSSNNQQQQEHSNNCKDYIDSNTPIDHFVGAMISENAQENSGVDIMTQNYGLSEKEAEEEESKRRMQFLGLDNDNNNL